MKRDPRDLLGAFRALAPPRPPIVLQRWSARRVALAATTLAIAAAAYSTAAALYLGPGAWAPTLPVRHRPHDDPQRPGSPVSIQAALPHGPPIGLAWRWRRHHQRARQILAGLRPARRARRDHHLDRGLRHLRRPADPLRPARNPPVRTEFRRSRMTAPQLSLTGTLHLLHAGLVRAGPEAEHGGQARPQTCTGSNATLRPPGDTPRYRAFTQHSDQRLKRPGPRPATLPRFTCACAAWPPRTSLSSPARHGRDRTSTGQTSPNGS
jgi:hypothetical protein